MVPRRNLCFPSISEIWLPKESSRGSAQPTVLTRILNFCPQCQRKIPCFIASWVWIQIRYKLVCKRKVVCICLLSSSISCYSWLCSNYFKKSQNIEDCLEKLFCGVQKFANGAKKEKLILICSVAMEDIWMQLLLFLRCGCFSYFALQFFSNTQLKTFRILFQISPNAKIY